MRMQPFMASQFRKPSIQVQLGDVSHLPFPETTFDRVFTINTIYFWPDALQGLTEIHRVPSLEEWRPRGYLDPLRGEDGKICSDEI